MEEEISALRETVRFLSAHCLKQADDMIKLRQECMEANVSAIKALQGIGEIGRLVANQNALRHAACAAELAVLQGANPDEAAARVREEFRQNQPDKYDPLLWGVRPDWLAGLTMPSGQGHGDS